MINPTLRMPVRETKAFPITGYLDRFSARPGGLLSAFVSTSSRSFDVRLVRVISGDPNPESLGLRFEDLARIFPREVEGRHQEPPLGSSVEIDEAPRLNPTSPHTWTVLCWNNCDIEQEATVLFHQTPAGSVKLSITPRGVRGELVSKTFEASLETPFLWRPGAWTRVWLSLDPRSSRIAVGVQPLGGIGYLSDTVSPGPAESPSGGSLFLAASPTQPSTCFTGKLEAPAILRGYAGKPDWAQASIGLTPVATWDFSQFIGSTIVAGIGPEARAGRTVNDPTRAVVGSTWTGREMCWRHAPDQYAAIHFHADDVGDFGWRESFAFDVPDELKSGAYALHLTSESGEDYLPFYVLPKRRGPKAKLVFLAPTYTYMAYANCFFSNRSSAAKARAARWGASPYNGRDYGSYGRSTYNWHADGSGVAFSTRRRPILTMRPGFVFADDPKGSGVRHYPADTHLLAWLEAKGYAFDVVTDEDLDDEGVDLIRDYAAVITGTHPEYHTEGTLDALQAYIGGGGNLAYLGANGFYWRIARDKARPDLIEVRRAEGGIRLWAAETGEYFHALDGQLGGLWRRNGRFPQSLTGVGFSAQGPFDAGHFRRTQASVTGSCAWIFEGVEGDILGDYGLNAGGAAGFELDRMDRALGSPASAVVLAVSEGLPATFSVAPEDMLTESLSLVGVPAQELVRGDMTYTAMPGGGAVFAAGSITFCGSLWRDRQPQGPVSTVLENVLNRFLAGSDSN